MTAGATLRVVLEALDGAGIPHMVVGSTASTAYSTPRATYDIDLVIDPTAEALTRFEVAVAAQGFHVAPNPHDALTHRGMCSAVDPSTGWKVDLVIRKDRPFSRAEFERRTEAQLFGIRVWMATPEDTVLSKLEWAKMGESDRQLRDASTVLAVRGNTIDDDYLDRWAPELGVEELLARARALATD